LVELLGRERPVALVLDDLHWADEASVEFVLHLLRRTPRVPHLLLFALRPAGPIAALRAARGWTEVSPAPLTPDGSAALLPAELDLPLRRRMAREAAGNPLFLRELGRLGAGAAGSLPGTVLATVQQELGRLPPTWRALAGGAAVAGDPFDPEVAAAAAGIDPAAAFPALDALVAADLVHPTPDPAGPDLARPAGDRFVPAARAFRFRHPLVHRAVYESVPPGTRIAAHGRAAEALGARGAAPAQRAYHVERCARQGDEQAVALLVEAAAGSTDAAPAAAAHWYGAAIGLLRHGDARRADLLAPLALALAAAGRLPESRAALADAIALLGPDQAARRTRLAMQLALVLTLLGAYEDAETQVRAAFADAPAAERPKLMLYHSSCAFARRDTAAIAEWAERGLRAIEGPALTAYGEAMVAIAGLWSGAVGAAAAAARRRARPRRDDRGGGAHGRAVEPARVRALAARPPARRARRAGRGGAGGAGERRGVRRAAAEPARPDEPGVQRRRPVRRRPRASAARRAGDRRRVARAARSHAPHRARPGARARGARGRPCGGRGALGRGRRRRSCAAGPARGRGASGPRPRRAAARARRRRGRGGARAGGGRPRCPASARAARGAAARRPGAAGGGRAAAALEQLQRVAAVAGAGALQQAAARELRRAGTRVAASTRRAATPGGPDALTAREREVAELVARGHTNKQVAAALFVTEKTVEHHLSRIYPKLGVRSRAGLAARLR
jgi:DNA-binding CsgD family transcriptional regulator